MEPPLKPDESDCCNSGCNPCILDVYEEQLKKYNAARELNLKPFQNCLMPTAYSVFRVTHIEKHCSDALIITFEFENFFKDNKNGHKILRVFYNPGQHVMLKFGPKNEEFQRPYTPIPYNNLNEQQFTVLIKIYEIGQMSRYIKKLNIGSKTVWRGPYGSFPINFTYKYIIFIAQGIGIAPLYSIICELLKNENCDTFLSLYYCCKSCDTIYLRDQLYNLQSNWNFDYKVFLSDIENVTNKYNETIFKHKLNSDFLKKYFSDGIENKKILVCGSETFMLNIKEVSMGCGIKETNIVLF